MDLTEYQKITFDRFVNRCSKQKGALIVSKLGSGKTYLAQELLKTTELHKIVIIPTSNQLEWIQIIHKKDDISIYTLDDLITVSKLDFMNCYVFIDNAEQLVKILRRLGTSKNRDKQKVAMNLIKNIQKAKKTYLFTATFFEKDWLDFTILINLAAGKTILPNNLEEIENRYKLRDYEDSYKTKLAASTRNMKNFLHDMEQFIRRITLYNYITPNVDAYQDTYRSYIFSTDIPLIYTSKDTEAKKTIEYIEDQKYKLQQQIDRLDKMEYPTVPNAPYLLPSQRFDEKMNEYTFGIFHFMKTFYSQILKQTFEYLEYKDYLFMAADYLIGTSINGFDIDKMIDKSSHHISSFGFTSTNIKNYNIVSVPWDEFQLNLLFHLCITKKIDFHDIIYLNKLTFTEDNKNYAGITYKTETLQGETFAHLSMTISNKSIDNYYLQAKRQTVVDYFNNRMYFIDLLLPYYLEDAPELKGQTLENNLTKNKILELYLTKLIGKNEIYKNANPNIQNTNQSIQNKKQKLIKSKKEIEEEIKSLIDQTNKLEKEYNKLSKPSVLQIFKKNSKKEFDLDELYSTIEEQKEKIQNMERELLSIETGIKDYDDQQLNETLEKKQMQHLVEFYNRIRGNHLFSCWKFIETLELLLEERRKSYFLPIVYSNFDEQGFQLFSAFLHNKGYYHLVIHPDDDPVDRYNLTKLGNMPWRKYIGNRPMTTQEAIDHNSKDVLEFQLNRYEDFSLEERDFQIPLCVLLHPSFYTGVEFPFTNLMILLETPLTNNIKENLVGRINRYVNEIDLKKKKETILNVIKQLDSFRCVNPLNKIKTQIKSRIICSKNQLPIHFEKMYKGIFNKLIYSPVYINSNKEKKVIQMKITQSYKGIQLPKGIIHWMKNKIPDTSYYSSLLEFLKKFMLVDLKPLKTIEYLDLHNENNIKIPESMEEILYKVSYFPQIPISNENEKKKLEIAYLYNELKEYIQGRNPIEVALKEIYDMETRNTKKTMGFKDYLNEHKSMINLISSPEDMLQYRNDNFQLLQNSIFDKLSLIDQKTVVCAE